VDLIAVEGDAIEEFTMNEHPMWHKRWAERTQLVVENDKQWM